MYLLLSSFLLFIRYLYLLLFLLPIPYSLSPQPEMPGCVFNLAGHSKFIFEYYEWALSVPAYVCFGLPVFFLLPFDGAIAPENGCTASEFLEFLHHPSHWYHLPSRQPRGLWSIKRPMISQLQHPAASTLARSSCCWLRTDQLYGGAQGAAPIHPCTFLLEHLTKGTESLKKSNIWILHVCKCCSYAIVGEPVKNITVPHSVSFWNI